ncbi:MAG: peptidoglycan DD-metalloendopeptidase family protein [Pseudomonadota bacterium]|jgi:murein DD-endopeptidase MepM/ murein hydrolase activator NlpD
MVNGQQSGARRDSARLFPERHIYLRSGDQMQTFVLSSGAQLLMAIAAAIVIGWSVLASGALLAVYFANTTEENQVAKTRARYERLNADSEARAQTAMSALRRASGSIDTLAQNVERRHAALAWLLQDFRGAPGAAQQLAPVKADALKGKSPVEQVQAVQADQARLIGQAEGLAHTRAERLRFALRMAGLDPSAYEHGTSSLGLGGPNIDAKDPRALAQVLDVDEDFATRIQSAARDLSDMRDLSAEAQRLPLGKPVDTPMRTSTFGVRKDPFTRRPAFHAGQDFAGAMMTPIRATGPGVVAFTGQRTGYGNVVEIDHGGGFKTRYAHLAAIGVSVGQRVAINQRIGAMGSTGRSTGPHLHYETWVNGRVQDPTRFLRAGEHVQQID